MLSLCLREFSLGAPDSSHNPKHVRLIGGFKLAIGANVRLDVCPSVCISSEIDWQPVCRVPSLSA